MNRSFLALVMFSASSIACGGKFVVADDSDGGSLDTGTASDTGSITCAPSACGPTPFPPAKICWDGSTPAITCERTATGTCGWAAGACPSSRCDSAADCGVKGFCDHEVGSCGGSGTCVLKPTSCGKNLSPTCGCDLVTYGNPCLMQKAGVSKLSEGECESIPPPIESCGGFAGESCSADHFCQYYGGGCGFADGGGSCVPRPSGCSDIYAPICGCDSKTYPNQCDAQQHGIDVQYSGACKK